MKCEKLTRMSLPAFRRGHTQGIAWIGDPLAPQVRLLQEENGASIDMPLFVQVPGVENSTVELPLKLKIDAGTSVTKSGTRRVMFRVALPYYRVTETPAATEGGTPVRRVVSTGAEVTAHLVFTLPKRMVDDVNGLSSATTASASRDVSSDAVRAQVSLLRRLAACLSNIDGRLVEVVDDLTNGNATGFVPATDPVTGQPTAQVLEPVASDDYVPRAETALLYGIAEEGEEGTVLQNDSLYALYTGETADAPLDRMRDALLRGIAGVAPLGDGICSVALAPTAYLPQAATH